MYVGREHAGKTFYDALGHSDKRVRINRLGYGNFFVEAGSVSVWLDENNELTPEGAVVL